MQQLLWPGVVFFSQLNCRGTHIISQWINVWRCPPPLIAAWSWGARRVVFVCVYSTWFLKGSVWAAFFYILTRLGSNTFITNIFICSYPVIFSTSGSWFYIHVFHYKWEFQVPNFITCWLLECLDYVNMLPCYRIKKRNI